MWSSLEYMHPIQKNLHVSALSKQIAQSSTATVTVSYEHIYKFALCQILIDLATHFDAVLDITIA